jgi:hypothetical protein
VKKPARLDTPDTVERIARAIYENHEEQCCTCEPWDTKGPHGVWPDGRDPWRTTARAVLKALEEILT